MIKTLTLTALVAAIGSIGLARPASAAGIFAQGGQLNFNVDTFQVNASGLPAIGPGPGDLPSPPFFPNLFPGYASILGTPAGGALGGISVTFSPLGVDPNFPIGQRVSNVCMASQTTGVTLGNPASLQCATGNFGQFRAGASSGVFNTPVGGGLLPFNAIGNIANFDGGTLDGGTGVPSFIKLFSTTNPEFAAATELFTIDLIEGDLFTYDPNNSGGAADDFKVTSIGAPGEAAAGTLTLRTTALVTYVPTGETSLAEFIFNVTGLEDNGTNGDFAANDGITNLTTLSGTVIIRPSVPEPSSLALIGGAALAGAGFLRRKSR
jgi:hypothetical protein